MDPDVLLTSQPPKLNAEIFDCDTPPGAWAPGSTDVEITINETKRTAAGQSCRQQLNTICRIEKAKGLVEGECPLDKKEG